MIEYTPKFVCDICGHIDYTNWKAGSLDISFGINKDILDFKFDLTGPWPYNYYVCKSCFKKELIKQIESL